VKAVEIDLGLWKVLGGTRLERAAHVHADMGNEVAGEVPERRLFSPRRGKQQALCVEVIKNSKIGLAALARCFIDARARLT